LLIGALVVALALAYFAFQAFQGATVYYYTVKELQREGQALAGRTVRVKGKLVPASFQRVPGTDEARFLLRDDNGDLLSASYRGALPDLFFNENSQLVLQGTYRPGEPFQVERILVQCPSKYQEAGPASEGGSGGAA